MAIREKLLKEAFEAAMNDPAVKSNDTDNADAQIAEAMFKYIEQKEIDDKKAQIMNFIDRETWKQNEMLDESFEKAVASDPANETDEERIAREMQNFFNINDAAIRTKRIELYIKEQAAKKAAEKK